MPRVVIDGREVEVPAGTTLLQAARRLGIDVPALCYRDGLRPGTSCMACVMRVYSSDGATERRSDEGDAAGRWVPSCATVVEDGMAAESETDAVRQVRRAALELLLSDHAGQCRAPCQYACPFHTDVPRLMREIAAGQLEQAGLTLRRDMPLAAVLTRFSAPACERTCQRRVVDAPVLIGLLTRYVAERSLSAGVPPLPPRSPGSGRRVAVVGAGPAGLSAAYFLSQQGHACTVFDARDQVGGTLLAIPPEQLPAALLDGEIALMQKLGVRFELGITIEGPDAIDRLRRQFDAVLLATGQAGGECGLLAVGEQPARVDRATHQTDVVGVFAAGDLVRPRGRPVLAAVEGKTAATCIDRYLRGRPVSGPGKLTGLRTGRWWPEEIVAPQSPHSPPATPSDSGRRPVSLTRSGRRPVGRPHVAAGPSLPPTRGAGPVPGRPAELTAEEAQAEARRCLHCDCRKLQSCQLRKYAEIYRADAARYRPLGRRDVGRYGGERRRARRLEPHPDILYEPGKCILCGLCVQIAEQAGEPLGLTFIGRGFDVGLGVPFDEPLAEALKLAARRCADVCPTGAMSLRNEAMEQWSEEGAG